MPWMFGDVDIWGTSGKRWRRIFAGSKLAPILVLLAILALLVQGSVFSSSPFVIAAQLLAAGLIVSARVAFGRQRFNVSAHPADGALLTRGPYRFIRHPMYAGALLFSWACVFGHWSPVNGAIVAVVTLLVALRIAAEEELLRERYPEYEAYARTTKRIIPFVL